MKGTERETMLLALGEFKRLTEAAERAADAAFLPSMAAGVQLSVIAEALEAVPPPDSVSRQWEITELVNACYRNALVVFARGIGAVREKEKKITVPTEGSEARLSDIIYTLRGLGDERDLISILSLRRNKEAVERDRTDPRQLEIDGKTAQEKKDARKTRGRRPNPAGLEIEQGGQP